MSTIKFKTNINCSGCVAKITPFIQSEKNIEKWEVDVASPDKIITVSGAGLEKELVEKIIRKAGFIVKGDAS